MADNGSFSMAYEYDLVGSALQMVQTSWNLAGKAQDATTTWAYDDRYRLTAETVHVEGVSPATRTEYYWDKADNRRIKIVREVEGATTTLVSRTMYQNNALNQTTSSTDGTTMTSYAYDANGNRTNMVRTVGGSPATTAYTYDEDNRLIEVETGPAVSSLAPHSTFAYDYRSRRYYRSTPDTPHMFSVFDGGLSIQEYETESEISNLSSEILRTEFIRGEGMGGGVGGMVYSIKPPAPGSQLPASIICSHSNHRGDIIARSDENGSLTSFALYEAYGKRIYEWDDGVTGDPDRQKANTKEEESDLDLLNEGFRYRDLETGVFLTRDPLRYWDGPNMYCYAHCNPITKFDALGLSDDDVHDAAEQVRDDASDLAETRADLMDAEAAFAKSNAEYTDMLKSMTNVPKSYSEDALNAKKSEIAHNEINLVGAQKANSIAQSAHDKSVENYERVLTENGIDTSNPSDQIHIRLGHVPDTIGERSQSSRSGMESLAKGEVSFFKPVAEGTVGNLSVSGDGDKGKGMNISAGLDIISIEGETKNTEKLNVTIGIMSMSVTRDKDTWEVKGASVGVAASPKQLPPVGISITEPQ